MTAQPRRKPRRVVLGKGMFNGSGTFYPSTKDYPHGDPFRYVNVSELLGGKRVREGPGRWVWEPDPPKAKR